MSRAVRAASLLVLLGLTACSERRANDSAPPTFRADVEPIFRSRCATCHSGEAPAGGWRATSYVESIGCVDSGAPAAIRETGSQADRAPIERAIDDERHRTVLDERERAAVRAWVSAGSPAFVGSVHASSIIDPRAPGFHGAWLRSTRYRAMLDANDPDACGRCHDGTSSRPSDVTVAAPGATACTSCHTEREGVVACTTCHGSPSGLAGPRDACFHPGDGPARAKAHGAHVNASASHATGLDCSTCHPAPLTGPADVVFKAGSAHGNGAVEIVFDQQRVAGGSFDRASSTCAVGCHDRGGARPRPAWTDTSAIRCGDCHASPPQSHFPGPCVSCHLEANASGSTLKPGPQHINGRIDLGDGSGGCGACHGSGDDPWPSTGRHAAHASPNSTTPIDCASCHPVPSDVRAPGHLDGKVSIVFGGRALDRGARPIWNGDSCRNTACHGEGLLEAPAIVPRWADTSGAASLCSSCHGAPPGTSHTASASCERSTCHGSEVGRSADGSGQPFITPSGRARHINGVIDVVR